ncbi:HAMP domain-containing sensor histidine kinase [Neobacillus piezotolerans]|uniref:HAMP domain-containing sensor histidine kinase n=1 Tax=Neobacillus piezotolerans TaxID=2259171 RepID=UPI001CA3B93E|nr:HAMP domain-containing sensor histidine kinase [Neobacillus piezotolerans]
MKNYSHSVVTKIIAFILVISCFAGFLKEFFEINKVNHGNFGIIFEENYFHSFSFYRENETLVTDLNQLIGEYKSEKHILDGGTVSEEDLRFSDEDLFHEYQNYSRNYNPNLSEAENYEKFKADYADKISEAREKLIKDDLRVFHSLLQRVHEVKEPLYFASDGVNEYKNSRMTDQEQFKGFPSYLIYDGYKSDIYPKEIEENEYFQQMGESKVEVDAAGKAIYVGFPEDYLNPKIQEWKDNKEIARNSFYALLGFLAGLILSFLYLVVVTGRKSYNDKKLHLSSLDKLYVDVNIVLCMILIAVWVSMVNGVPHQNLSKMVIPITLPIAIPGLFLVLSLVRHLKNRTFFKHSLVYQIIYRFIKFVRNVYDSGSIGVKTVLIVIGYPILVGLTFFIFPITLGLAAWFSLKKIKAFQAIQDGVEKIKDGDIHHRIYVGEKGEFAGLAADINSITDGLKKAVDSELKSERLKTELITNVSHDIRTPLTSIITYVDLLKREKDPAKAEEYIDVLDQKSKRLKVLTDDLFEAAKASSGNIPVQLERIDMVSLLTQGLGEVNDKIEASGLDFKINFPSEKVIVKTDGKLLWRSIENILSNIFKYALPGSRVYIQIEDAGNKILLSFKNISAYELNISADELMERFKRGDESRSNQGSGLGLSIVKSLIEIQGGKFAIQIDGDLFKSVISLPKEQ